MSNEFKPRTKEDILKDITIVKDKIKPQFEAVENYIHNVRPKLVEEKQVLWTIIFDYAVHNFIQ